MSCGTGYTNILDSFLNPDGTPWTGSITYTLIFATTVAGETIINARQIINVSDGIDLCLAPGIYNVVYNQSGQDYPVSGQWTVPTTGGPYTVADVGTGTSTIGEQGPVGPTGPTGPTGPQGPTGSSAFSALTSSTNTQLAGQLAGGASIYTTGTVGTVGGAISATNAPTISPSELTGLLSAIAKVNATAAGSIVLNVRGDSWCAGSTWAQPLRNRLQQAWGFGGVGYVALDTFDATLPTGATRTTTGTWTNTTSIYSPHLGAVSSVDFATPAQKTINCVADTFVIYYRGGGGVFRYRVDSGGWTSVDTSGQSGNQTVTISGQTVPAAHNLDIQPVSGAAVLFFGIEGRVTSGTPVRVNVLARNGSTAQDWAGQDATALGVTMTAMAPAMNIQQIGVNDWQTGRSAAQYKADLTTIVSALGTAAATADVVLMSQADSGYSSPTGYAPFVIAMQEVSLTTNTPFVDVYHPFGPYLSNAYGNWNGAQHPSAQGGEFMARIVESSLPQLLESPNLRTALAILAGVNQSATAGTAYGGLFVYDQSVKGVSNVTIREGANQANNPLFEAQTSAGTAFFDIQDISSASVYMTTNGRVLVLGTVSASARLDNIGNATRAYWQADGSGWSCAAAFVHQWSPNSNPNGGAVDTGLSRAGVATLAVGNGAAGDTSGKLSLTNLNVVSGGSTTISTGVGSVKMSSANAATNTVWIPIQYNGTTYYVPGFTTNAP